MKRILIMPDIQAPYENRKQFRSFVRFLRDWKPDKLLMIGDVGDFPSSGRWNKDARGEFEATIWDDSKYVCDYVLSPIREEFDGDIECHESNHDDRPWLYQQKYAPAADTVNKKDNPFYFGNLFKFDHFNITDVGGYHDIAPGWLSTHGHLGMSLRQTAGGTAIAAARKYGKSIVCGHTHRAGIISETIGWGDHAKTLTGFEVGHMMEPSRADYIQKKGGFANWQAGFGILWVDGRMVKPEFVPMNRHGEFLFEGRRWK